MRALSTRLEALVAREHGIALVMVIGVMMVLGIVGATAILYTSSNYRAAARSRADQTAHALAEAGINNAASILSLPANNALGASTLPPPPPSTSARVDTYDAGTVKWGGTLDTANGVWTVTAIGSVASPNGSAAVTRKVTAKIPIVPTYTQPVNNQAWNYVFATRTGNQCDLTFSNNVSGASRVYVYGNLCLSNNVQMTPTAIVVRQNLQLSNGAAVGASTSMATRIETYVGGGCAYGQGNFNYVSPCPGDSQQIYSKKNPPNYVVGVNSSPVTITPPVAEWDRWYQNGTPGPKQACTTSSGTVPVFDNNTVRDNSVATPFDLTPSNSYTCRVGPADEPFGELSWNASTKVLTIHGTVFIDGSAKSTNGSLNQYNGQGTLYLSGTFLLSGKLCALTAGSQCATSTWDPNTEMLAVVANGNGGQVTWGSGVQLTNNSSFQGAFFATNAISLDNNAISDGPMVGATVNISNNVVMNSFPAVTLPAGMPGNPTVYAEPAPPCCYSG